MKILFQGDSITDAGRNRENFHDMGEGYPKYAVENIKNYFPEIDFEFVNLGISGDQTKDLVARLQSDFIDIQPDIVSILIGVNDTWHKAENREWYTDEYFEQNYRTILEAIKEKTNARIMMIEQFLLPAEDKAFFRQDLDPKIQITRKLAREYADVFIPLDGLLAAETLNQDWQNLSADGVHPTPDAGSEFIGQIYADKIVEIIEDLCTE